MIDANKRALLRAKKKLTEQGPIMVRGLKKILVECLASMAIMFAALVAQPEALSAQPYPAPNCPAKETGGLSVTGATVLKSCGCASDFARVQFDYEFYSNATRYDILFGYSIGGTVLYDSCLEDISANPTVFSDIDGEGECGDVNANSSLIETIILDIPCDADGDGMIDAELDAQLLMGWKASGGGRGYDTDISDPKCSGAGTNPRLQLPLTTTMLLSKLTNDPTNSGNPTGTFDFTRSGSIAPTSSCGFGPGYDLRDISITTVTEGVAEQASQAFLLPGFDPATQSYTEDVVLTEAQTAGFALSSISCSVPGTEDLAAGTYTISAADIPLGEELTCAFVNTAFEPMPEVTLTKTASPSTFSTAGEIINYTLTVTNTGNTALENVAVSDPLLPGLTCSPTVIEPLSSTNTDNTAVCSGNYTILQSDIDNAAAGRPLVNNARVTADAPNGQFVSAIASEVITGPTSQPAMILTKTPAAGSYSAVGDLLIYDIAIRNTGNVTWPSAPAVTDSLDPTVNCPSGPVAPGNTVTCQASYLVTQTDLDNGDVLNTASATVTVNGAAASDTDNATVSAVILPALTVAKSLASGPDPFSATTDQLTYSYLLTNTGNVRLDAVALVDDKVGLTCPATSIAAGDSITCTSDPYAITQADLNAGSVTNTATANATAPDGTPIAPVVDDLTIDADQSPALTMDKTGSIDGSFLVNETISYSYLVTNTGNVELPGPFTVSDNKFGSAISCPAGPLAPTESVTCQATYTITLADVSAGFVNNTASATTDFGGNPVTSNTDSVSLSPTGNPSLEISKSADLTEFTTLGETITYTFIVTNNGTLDIDLTGVDATTIVADDKIAAGGVDCADPDPLPAALLIGESLTCTGTYDVTQDDIDAGEVVNLATATLTVAGSDVTSPQTSETVPANITPGFTLDKATATADFGNVGDPIDYTFSVTNSSVQTITTVDISDPLLGGFVCSVGPIGPNATESCVGTFTYNVTQADLDRGFVTNVATGNGRTPTGALLTDTDTETVNADATVLPSLAIDKRASTTTFAAVGDVISYVIDVTNDGKTTLTDVQVTDPQLGLTCNLPAIAPGATNSSCSGSHTISQADIDAGSYLNTATATSAANGLSETDPNTVTGPTRAPAVSLTKTVDSGFTVENDVVNFTLTATNTGNVTLTNVTISDPDITFAPACLPQDLAPGASYSCSAPYSVTQPNVDAGGFTNTGDVAGTPPSGPNVSDMATVDVVGPTEAPSLSVDKSIAGNPSEFAAGDTLTYNFVVTNTGNVTLTGLSINDPDPRVTFTCPLDDLAPGASTSTCAGGAPALTADLVITQAEIDDGAVINTVDVIGQSTIGTPVNATDEITTPGPDQTPELSIAKSSPTGGFTNVGDTITYDYVVTNVQTGNPGAITITEPITVDDDRTPVVCDPIGAGLAPGDSLNCTATYSITQADLDAGAVTNVAFAEVTQPVVPSATYPTGTADIDSPTDTVTVNAGQTPGISIQKAVTAGTPSTFTAVGDTISYTFTVRNTGNVTLTAPFTVNDPDVDPALSCGSGAVAPGAAVTCTAIWTAEQSDIDAGTFTNTATASTTFGSNPVNTPTPGSVTVNAVQTPSMEVAKSLSNILGDGGYNTSSTLEYTYEITNTGNQTIVGPINIVDNLIGTFLCFAGNLDPTDPPVSCTATYPITAQDVALGSVTNTAFASSPTVDSPPTSETVPEGQPPIISITKTPDVASFNAIGDDITYTFTVTNTSPGGALAPSIARKIVIRDDNFPGLDIDCFDPATDVAPAGPTDDLDPGETFTCTDTVTYTIDQDDLDRVKAGLTTGFVTNNATGIVTTVPSGTAEVTSPPVQVTVPGEANNLLTVDKSVTAGNNPAAVGDPLTYQITVDNDGNQTISGLAVSDPLIPGLSCLYNGAATPTTLAPGQQAVCTGTYTVTQADLDAGTTLDNVVDVAGNTPQGVAITGTDGNMHPLVTPDPEVTILKELAQGDPMTAFSAVGQQIPYQITVTNSGNITLTATTVTDVLFPGEQCDIGALAPGQSDTSCVFVYTVTQEDVDRGTLNNVATASSTTDNYGPVDDSDAIMGQGPAREPEITVLKTALDTTFRADGDSLRYRYVVANTGNITIEDITSVTDDLIPSLSCGNSRPDTGPGPAFAPVLLPGSFFICTGTYTVDQMDVDAGQVTNIATAEFTDPTNPLNTIDDTDTVTVNGTRAPAFTVAKSASDTTNVAAGDTITYTYTVRNTGNVTLTNITLSDAHTSASGTANLTISGGGTITSLAPTGTAQLTATYLVTQQDIDAGDNLTNVVTANATPPVGVSPPPTQTADETVDLENPAPGIETVKTVTPTASLVAGQTVVFDITLRNTGNVTLSSVSLSDTLRRADNTLISPSVPSFTGGDAGSDGQLGLTEVWTYQLTHVLTQADIDAGGLVNTATANAQDPFNTPVFDVSHPTVGGGSTPTTLPIVPMPDIEGEKIITAGPTTVGATVRFEITATNTGNVTLTGVRVPQDVLRRADGTLLTLTAGPTFLASDAGSGSGRLIPGETATYRASYVLVQADIDAGGINNRARVAGTDPNGTNVNDLTDAGTPGDNSDRTVLTIPSNPALTLVKTLTAGGPTFDAVNDPLTYTFAVTNAGNVTITDPITITDPLITNDGGTITCAPVPLAPGATLNCTGTYTVDQNDLNTGQVDNSATATDGTTTSPAATASVPAQQNPAVSVDKSAVSISTGDNDVTNPANFVSGAVISFEYVVRNTGNINLTGPITVADNLIPGGVTCPANPAPGLAPGASEVCTGTYSVTQPDVDVGSATNTASATIAGTTSPPDSVTVPAGAAPGLTISKTLVRVENPDTSVQPGLAFDEANDVLVFQFLVTNTGNAAFTRDITIDDPLLDAPVTCWTPVPVSDPDFTPANATDPAETATCEGRLTVDQADLDAGTVFNSATANTNFGPIPGTPVISASDSETATAATDPALTIVKSANVTDFTNVGDVITYTLTVTNSGNQTISSIQAVDNLIPLSCSLGALAPGASDNSCSASYSVTQADIDAGSILNAASVTGITPQGGPVQDDTTLTVGGPTAAPNYSLTKTASPDPFGAVGTGVTYTFTVVNTGNVTLTNVAITDDIVTPAFACTVAQLNVGATDNTCTLSYTVTQDDKDAGEIVNTADATATDPNGTTVDRTDTITTPSVPAMPGLKVVKTSSAPNPFLGTDVTYTLRLINTGDVSLTINSLTDTMTRRNFASTPTVLTTPFGSLTGDTDGDGFLDVTEVWTYTATKRITQADIDAGGFDNTVLVSASDPFGTPVEDRSDDGDDTDGNTDEDPTEFVIIPGPAISLVKTIATPGAVAGDEVVFNLLATNQGNTTLFGIGIADTLTDANGTVISTAAPQIVNPASLPGSIAPGQQLTFELRYVLTQADIDSGGISNTATVSGTAPNGNPVDDVSDNGDDTDGNTSDDPTVLTIAPSPALEVTKVVVPFADPGATIVAGDVVEFTITAENTGTVTLTDLSIADTLTNLNGDALTPDSVTFASGDDETVLLPAAVNTFTVLHTLTQADIDSGGVENTATAEATSPAGDPITDISDDGIDDDGNTVDDPTVFPINQIASVEATKDATTPILIAANLYSVTFDITVTNTGNITQTELQVTDDLVAFTTPAELVSTTAPTASGWSGTGGPNPAFNGATNINLLTSGVSLAPGDTGTLQIIVRYDTSQGFPGQPNVVSVVSSSLIEAVTAEASIPRVAAPDIFATKSVAPEEVLRGATVTYTLTFENRLAQAEPGLTVVDDMPPGVLYTPGTAAFDGVAIDDPIVVGNQLRWTPVTLAPLGTSSLTFDARVVGDAVEMTNRTYMLGPDGTVVSNIATATLTRPPEPVFECADIIGKVFDDENFNGYQDGIVEPDRSLITDQTYYGGKGGGKLAPEVVTPGAEQGLPNVRLSTVNGTLITTDAYGRFSVPCAELPAAIGSNFTLKLDERTLPTGYAVTTENPRTIRVTPGTVAKLNFGAALGNVIDIDLMAAAFNDGSATPNAALAGGIDGLIQRLGDVPAVLNLNYYRNGESRDVARARLDAAEALIRDRWRGDGLRIVRAIRAVQ